MSNVSAKDLFHRLQTYLSDEAIKKIITYSFFGLLPILSGFLLTPFYTRFLSQEEYGKLSYYNILQGYATLIVILGVDNSLSRYYFEFRRNKKVLEEMFASAFQFMFFFSLLISGIIFLANTFLAFTIPVTIYAAIIGNTLFTAIITTFINYYRDSQKLNQFILYSILLFLIISTSAITGIIFISNDADGCILGRLAGLTFLAFLIIGINSNFFFQRFSLKLVGKLILFGLPFIPYSVIGTVYDSIDRFLIEKAYTLKHLAIYNISFVIAFLINVVVNSLMQTYNPKIYSVMNEPKAEQANSLKAVIELRKNMFAIICLCAILISLLCYPFIYIFAGPTYLESTKYVPLIAFSFVLRLYFTVYATPLFYHKKSILLSLIILVSLLVFFGVFYSLNNLTGLLTFPIALIFSRAAQIGMTYALVKQTNYSFDFTSGIKHKLPLITGLICGLLTFVYYSLSK